MKPALAMTLKKIFNLTDAEFNNSLTRHDISSWDSLRHMSLITTVENDYSVNLEIEDILAIDSFPALLSVLKKHGVSVEG